MISGLIRLFCFIGIGSVLYSLGTDVFSWQYWAVMLLTIVIGCTC